MGDGWATAREYRTPIGSPLYFRHPASREHDTGFGHPERAERIVALERELDSRDWLGWRRQEAPRVELDQLLAVHPREHVEAARELSARSGAFDPDTPTSPGSYEAALRSAGGAATGRRITRQLSALVATDERIGVLELTTAVALWTREGRCMGLVTQSRAGTTRPLLAGATVLATGGAAALWLRNTNPPGAVGAGLSLAHAAGAALADLEFVQFHPTALAAGVAQDGFLITEAVRGEGATLLGAGGRRFVDELAPRDQVALAIQAELRRSRESAVGLDMRAIDLERFPNIAATLTQSGLDPRREPVPVAPAAHYAMGGIATDLDGRSRLPGLYAVGECACTGLHGANRLASNSLAECFVFGRRTALAAREEPQPPENRGRPPAPGPPPLPDERTRAALWEHAGLERDAEGLRKLLDEPHPLARLVASACLAREESRGAHQRTDHPDTDPALDSMHAVVGTKGEPAFEPWR